MFNLATWPGFSHFEGMHILLISLGVLILFILGLNWLANTTPKKFMIALALTAGILLLGVSAFLVITGKIAFAIPSFAGAWAAFQKYLQLRGVWQWAKDARQKKQEQAQEAPQFGMSREEALEIMGLDESAGTEDVKAAYKKLMLEHHPDQQGADKAGNAEFAQKVNAARDRLLGKK